MLRTLRRIWSYCNRRTNGVPVPDQWMVEVTNRCNLRCAMCTRHSVPFAETDMPLPVFQQLIDKADVEAIWPYGFGEPMLHADLWAMVAYAKKKGIIVSLSTNATLLNAANARQLIESGLDYLILAIDGATPSTYEKNRGGARFESVRRNIEAFLTLKTQRGAPVHVTLQMIRLRNNAHEAAAFREIWRRRGVDRIRIREDLSKLPGIGSERASHPAKRAPCYFLWRGPFFVQAAGTVIPCPYYHGEAPFGDLRTDTPQQVWNSERMVELRQAHIEGRLSAFPICERCPRHHPHPIIAAFSFLATTRDIRKYLPIVERLQELLPWKFIE